MPVGNDEGAVGAAGGEPDQVRLLTPEEVAQMAVGDITQRQANTM